MRVKHLIHTLAVMSAVTVLAATGAQAQTKAKAPVTTPSRGAFDKLSLGNQKVAAALYYAQSADGAANRASPSRRPFTLEAIAAKRQSGQTWGQIFRELKAQGLVHDKSLGHVVARYQQTLDSTPGLLASDSSGGRSSVRDAGSDGSVGGAAHSVGKGGK